MFNLYPDYRTQGNKKMCLVENNMELHVQLILGDPSLGPSMETTVLNKQS